MTIHELSRDECLQVLAGARLARLACVKEGQPYIVPVYIAYDRPPEGEPRLYGFTTPGQKVEWMRANPLVCVEVDDVAASDHWVSVLVFGRYEELPDTLGNEGQWLRDPEVSEPGGEGREAPGRLDERLLAYGALQAQAAWWQPGSSAHVPAPAGRLAPIYYRVSIDRVTGHRATPDPRTTIPPVDPPREEGWLGNLLHFVDQPPSS
jgi:uncharacterized protein